MDKQTLRNELCEIEDKARAIRNSQNGDLRMAFALIARLTMIIRQEIVQ